MPVLSVTLPTDGENATAASVDSPITAVVNLLNGGLDHDNMVDGGITSAKLATATVTIDKLGNSVLAGWAPLGSAPSAVVANGNRSYNLTFSSIDLTSILSPGMRLQLTRSVAAPTKCTSLNGSTQYYSCASASLTGMNFTDTFSASAWVKLSSYALGVIVSRYNGTSGWDLNINASGQLQLIGFNANVANYRAITSFSAIPLNKWVHVAATLQMSDHTSSTCAIYIDGVLAPSTIASGGTAPTSLIQAGNLEIGSTNGGTAPFGGKIAQVAIYDAVITGSTLLASSTLAIAGAEASLVSAYSFNSVITDLNSNHNDLTANGSALATAT